MKTLFIVHDDCSDDRARRSPNLVRTLFSCYYTPFSIVMWITAAALGAVLPVLLLHFRCSTPVPGYRLPVTHCTLPIAHS